MQHSIKLIKATNKPVRVLDTNKHHIAPQVLVVDLNNRPDTARWVYVADIKDLTNRQLIDLYENGYINN